MSDIIELLERRDELGLVLLKEKYSDYCYSILYNLLRDHDQAEEALSDVWLQIWNSIPPCPARPDPGLLSQDREKYRTALPAPRSRPEEQRRHRPAGRAGRVHPGPPVGARGSGRSPERAAVGVRPLPWAGGAADLPAALLVRRDH